MKKFLFLFILLFPASLAFAKFDPAFTWNTLESPHFFIHYHQGGEELAKRAAVIAEDVHARLVPRIKWEPKSRTHMVLVDAMDVSNGMAAPIPYNHITLFLTQPLGEPGFGTMAYDEWLRLLITHEYTHTLHLDMVTGVPDAIQSILGRVYFPNEWAPIWMIEGIAVYEETEQTSGGRGSSPGSEMIIRMAVLEDRFPSRSKATTFPDTWPAGEVPYLFGESFSRFLAQKFGRDKLADVYVAYSGRGFPFLVDATAKNVLQADIGDLWNEWHAGLQSRYEQVRTAVNTKGLTASLPLTQRGYMNVAPAFSPDGAQIAYTVLNADEFPGIYLMKTDGTGDHKVVDNVFSTTSSGESIAWSPDNNGIYYTKLEVRRNTNLYNDIYFYDLKNNNEIRLTRGLRARDPYPSPDGKKLLFVTSKLGKTRLALAALPTDKTRLLTDKDISYLSEESVNQYETPRFSPDGSMIAVGVWQPGGYKDIWVLDAQGNKLSELSRDRAIDGGAVWSPDNKIIYFASDRTGIFNLFGYELATKKVFQITNVLGGAFTPTPSPDGKMLVFSSYGSKGYDLHMRPADPASWKPAEPFKDTYPVMTYNDKPVETKVSSYNPLPTLAPRFWLPWFGYSHESGVLTGALTFGQDAVEHHSYFFSGLYGPKNYRKWYTFQYAYDGFDPTFMFLAQDTDVTYGDLLSDATGTKDYVERSKKIDASLIFPLLKFERQQAIIVGYRRNEVSALTSLPPWPGYGGPVPSQGELSSGRLIYKFNSAKEYGFSISPEQGRTVELGFEQFDKALGSDFSVKKYTADWHEYINFPWKHHVLLARGFAGTSTGDVLPQRAFQLGGDSPGDVTIPVDDESVFLRGYPEHEFRGRKAALASLEYRLPIANIEAGIGDAPIFLRRIHGAVFVESGNAWDEGFHVREFKSDVGAEARFDLYFAYFVPLQLRIGVAKGLDEKREYSGIFNLLAPALF